MATAIPPELVAREAVQRQMEQLAQAAPDNLAAHAALFHQTDTGRPIIPARHHKEWVRFAHDVENYRWIVIICPPAYAKSTWWSIVYPTWRIGQTGGRIRIGLISNTANLTYGFSRAIMKAISDPRYEAVYGTTGSVDPKNPNVMATGIGGPVQGMRFDEIICDDLTTWDDARSDLTMDNQRFFVRGTLIKRFPPGFGPPDGQGRMIVAMTRWSERDLVPLFEDMGFKIITMPALGYWDKNPDGSWGTSALWPERESQEWLEAEREDDPMTFELVKQGNASVMGGDVFDTAQLNRAKMPKRGDMEEVVQFVDTAGGKDRERGDYFAMATLGIQDGGQKVWVLDVDRGRYPAPEQERRVEWNARDWDPNLVLIEDRNEGTALFQRLIVNTRLPLKAWMPVKDKEFRAIPFANAVNTGKVWIPLTLEGKAYRWTRAFELELEAFPRGANDDQVDAAASAYAHTGGAGPRLRVLSGQGGGIQRRRLGG
jgi:predicted phage terminase large subunit-like protein